jgi:hypothetical protein
MVFKTCYNSNFSKCIKTGFQNRFKVGVVLKTVHFEPVQTHKLKMQL